MPILKATKVWKKPTRSRQVININRLTDEEVANVVAALKVLHAKHGGWKELGRLMGLNKRVARYARGEARPTAGMALKVARLAKASVDDVLSGEFAKPRVCPTCGRPM